ncbi:hypothetical protein CERSUDRAFT_113533 [Gelatoporia subvermispora B]|uniref:GDP/GTP exchange factor Sec2 N-terminal domain-containing protein n=1 Tax=Ceriporiopsis subvermispora (strain B) TaxID=914234 RepID=M2QMV7_CERS8|nr:hypothetical protein CERSUDRAFT_113533 [Gelatoporia subvermispora B]
MSSAAGQPIPESPRDEYGTEQRAFTQTNLEHGKPPEPLLELEIPPSELDLTMTFESILSETAASDEPETKAVYKRASNVLKLSQENEKLKEELRLMTERLEAAERKQQELRQKALRSGAEEDVKKNVS